MSKEKDNQKDLSIEETILTKDGYEKLKKELDHLENISREEIAERIKVAISFGDLSENSEYEDAKREQSYLEGKIAELKKKLNHVKIIEDEDKKEKKNEKPKVYLGSKVLMEDIEFSKKVEFTIVGSMEFDPENLKISNVSPVGKAVLGKKVDDVVKVKLPGRVVEYKILKIN